MVTVTATTLLLAAITIGCTSFAQLLQKQAAMDAAGNKRNNGLTAMACNPSLINSALLLTAGMSTWLLVLKQLDVSVAYPLLSLNFILVPLLARWRFNEQIHPHRVVGSAIIVTGLLFLFAG